MGTERFNLVLKLYPEEIQLSKKRKEIWYHVSEGDDLPKNIRSNIGTDTSKRYFYDAEGWVIDRETMNKAIRNKKTAGKPNMQRINGQSIWDGSVDRYARNNLKVFLTEYFGPAIIRQWPENIFTPNHELFFHFEFIFYMPITLRAYTVQDIDNHAYPYTKAFTDTLTKIAVIPDDNAKYYRGYYCRYVDIPTEDDRRLEIKLHFCKNNERLW